MLIMKSLLKIGSALVLVSTVLFGLPSLLEESVSAAGCVLASASWGVNSTTINRPTPMIVQGQGCKGYVVAIHAYTMSGGAEITPTGGLTATFTNDTSVTVTHSFNPPGYGASGIVQIFFNASANNTQVNSGGILLGVTSETPPPITVSPPPIITPGPTVQGTPGSSVKYQFDIPNPIKANDFISLITEISKWITAIAIPIAVIAIVYAGILWLTAGAYPKNVEEAKRVLKYALIGLAIIIIGRGFITLIESIINLGGSS